MNFLLETYNAIVNDTPTDNFSGYAVSTDIGDNSRIITLIILLCLICGFFVASFIWKKVKARKTDKKAESKTHEETSEEGE